MRPPEISWDKGNPIQVVWITLYGPMGDAVTNEDVADLDERGRAFAFTRVDFTLSDASLSEAIVPFRVTVDPNNVTDHAGNPLKSGQIDGVIGDLERYERALRAQTTQP